MGLSRFEEISTACNDFGVAVYSGMVIKISWFGSQVVFMFSDCLLPEAEQC